MTRNACCYPFLCLAGLMCILMFTACGTPKKEPAAAMPAPAAKEETAEPSAKQEVPAQTDEPSTVRIGIYTVDPDSFEIESTDAIVNSLDPADVLGAVVLLLEDDDIFVDLNSTRQDGDKLFIDLHADEEYKPLGDVSAEAEAATLDCLCYSIFDNFEDIKEIYFSVDGGTYESGHIMLPLSEPYQVID